MKDRPTGIIRTLPSLYAEAAQVGHQRYTESIEAMKRGECEAIYIAMAQKPTVEVLYMYLLMDGQIKVRLNIASYEPGDARECWDETIRKPKYWAVCTGPLSFPDHVVKRRGFQGFRYCGDLW